MFERFGLVFLSDDCKNEAQILKSKICMKLSYFSYKLSDSGVDEYFVCFSGAKCEFEDAELSQIFTFPKI